VYHKAGKEILIKAVAQSILTYAMSVFQLPTSLGKELNSMMGRFWCGTQGDSKGIHWIEGENL
jgi:hypothetical protein